MKWIRYLVPLVLVAVASTVYGQWGSASSRYAPTSTAGSSRPQMARVSRLIVAEEPAPVAAGEETIVSSGPGMPCDDCGAGGWYGHHHGGMKWSGHCKTKRHCCAARSCEPTCAPSCGWSGPRWGHGGCSDCGGCAVSQACNDCGTCSGVRHKWLHGCGLHGCHGIGKPHFSHWSYGAWNGNSCGCGSGVINHADDTLAPQPEPSAGEPIEAPRQSPRSGTNKPAAQSASRGGQWPTWSTSTWTSPQPTRARPSAYEYRTR